MSLFPPEDKKIVELVKHTAAIHIKGNLSLVDRKVLNVLLKNAYDELGDVRYHTIRLSQIKNWVGWNSRNYDDLKNSLGKLVRTKIEWNIFGQDKKNHWFVSSMLASASIAGGKCTYDFPFHLQGLLKNPNIYGRINLLSQNNFKSKYSLILWEFLMSHVSHSKNESIGTAWLKIKDYRDMMGVDDKTYSVFKEFSFCLVRSPIKEINKVSEINVEAQYQKTGDKVTAVRFMVSKKLGEKEVLIKGCSEDVKAKLLNFCKLSSSTVDQILEKYDHEQLIENIAYIEAESKRGVVKNIAAYSMNAIKNDFRLSSQLSLDIKPFKEESKEIKGFRENLKRAFIHNQLDYDIYLNGSDVSKTEGGFLILVSDKALVRLVEKYSDILEKFKITLEIKK